MIKCHECGAENHFEGAVYCRKCGAKLGSSPKSVATDIEDKPVGQPEPDPVQDQATNDEAVSLDTISTDTETDYKDESPSQSGDPSQRLLDELNKPDSELEIDEPTDYGDVDISNSTLDETQHSTEDENSTSSDSEYSGLYTGTHEIELPETSEDTNVTDGTSSHADIEPVNASSDQALDDAEKKKLISDLQSKIPSMIQNKQKTHLQTKGVSTLSRSDADTKDENIIVSDYNRELPSQADRISPVQEEMPEMESSPNVRSRPSSEKVPRSKGIAYFKKNDIHLSGGIKFRNGEEITYKGKTFVLKQKARDFKSILLFGVLGLVIALLLASNFMKRTEVNPYAPLVGVVVDATTQRILPDVKVTLDGLGKSVMSNANGMFLFDMVPNGNYTIKGETPFFKTASLSFSHSGDSHSLFCLRMEEDVPTQKAEQKKETKPKTTPAKIRKYGNIKFTTNVREAEIILDNKSYGSGNRTIKKVLEGKHKLVVRSDGYETYTGTIRVKRNRTASVDVELVKIEVEKPREPTAAEYAAKGDSVILVGDYQSAIRNYTLALEKVKDGRTYYKRGQAYLKAGRPDNAKKDFMRAGNYLASSGQVNSAVEAYTVLLDLAPADMKALRARGNAYIQNGDYQLGLADFKTACDLDSKNYLNQLGYGNAYSAMGKHKDAIKAYKKAEKLTDDKAEVYALIALTSLARGKEKDARKYYKKFLKSATPDIEQKYASDPEWQRLKQVASSD